MAGAFEAQPLCEPRVCNSSTATPQARCAVRHQLLLGAQRLGGSLQQAGKPTSARHTSDVKTQQTA
jgi:hypothetical protein